MSAAWSPDGSRIVFQSNRNGDYDLFVMDADGANVEQLTSGIGDDWAPAWSPDGARVAFMNEERRVNDLVVMNLDGGHKRRIVSFHGDVSLYGLEWSPNGRWIAFTKWNRQGAASIYLIRPDGTGLGRLPTPRGFDAELGSWSPDGRRLVFSGARCPATDFCQYDIWTVRRDGSELNRVVKDELWQYEPHWSPDGQHIVYTNERNDPAGGGDVWIVNIDGTGNRQLLAKPDSYDYAIAWQPLP